MLVQATWRPSFAACHNLRSDPSTEDGSSVTRLSSHELNESWSQSQGIVISTAKSPLLLCPIEVFRHPALCFSVSECRMVDRSLCLVDAIYHIACALLERVCIASVPLH